MPGGTITVEGLPQAIAALKKMAVGDARLKDGLLTPLTEKIVSKASATCPVRTGRLRSSTQAKSVTKTSAEGGSYAPYAGYVEFGGPRNVARHYMQKAVLSATADSQRLVDTLFRDIVR